MFFLRLDLRMGWARYLFMLRGLARAFILTLRIIQ